jgi:hypothetical protein
MDTHEQENTKPPKDRKECVCTVVYHPVDPEGDPDFERRLNKAFDLLFAKVLDIDS